MSTKVSEEHVASIFSVEVYSVREAVAGKMPITKIRKFHILLTRIIPRKTISPLQVLYTQVQFLPLKSHSVSIKKPKCIKLCKNIIPVNCMNQT